MYRKLHAHKRQFDSLVLKSAHAIFPETVTLFTEHSPLSVNGINKELSFTQLIGGSLPSLLQFPFHFHQTFPHPSGPG